MNKLVAKLTGLDVDSKKKLKQSSCVLSISLGRQETENEKLVALIKLIDVTFQSCCILLGDSLQCYNLELLHAKPRSELFAMAIKDGDVWLEENKKYYGQLTIPYKITRWNEWLQHKEFTNAYKQVLHAYNYNESFFQAVSFDQKNFLDRLFRKEPNIELGLAEKNCRSYILEECAVFTLLGQENFHYEIYPGKRVQSLVLTRELFILDDYPDSMVMLNVVFKEAKSLETIKEFA